MTIYDIFPDIIHHPLFLNTDPETVNRFLTKTALQLVTVDADRVAYSSEAEQLKVGVVISGVARVYTAVPDAGSAGHTLLRTLTAGSMFGIANLYAEGEPFPTQIRTAEPCSILFLDGMAFRSWIESDPVALRNYLILQSKKLVFLNRKIAIFTAGSAEKKLALFLLENEVAQCVTPPCTMSELANLLNLGRASLYRALESLEESGLIRRQGKTILILDKKALSALL